MFITSPFQQCSYSKRSGEFIWHFEKYNFQTIFLNVCCSSFYGEVSVGWDWTCSFIHSHHPKPNCQVCVRFCGPRERSFPIGRLRHVSVSHCRKRFVTHWTNVLPSHASLPTSSSFPLVPMQWPLSPGPHFHLTVSGGNGEVNRVQPNG